MGLGCRATSLRLPPCVHVAREGPSPKAYVSSSLALPWPVPGPVCPPWCDDAMSGPDPTVGARPVVTLSANSPLAAIRFGDAGELEVAIVGLVVDLPYGLVPPLPLPPPPFPEGGVGWVVVAWCRSLAVGRGAPWGLVLLCLLAMRQRKLGSHTPPCHRRMVITTLFSVLLAALQRRPVLYHTRWLLTVHWLWSSGH